MAEEKKSQDKTHEMPKDKKRMIAIIAAVAVLAVALLAFLVPSCNKKDEATSLQAEEPKETLKRPESGPLAKGEFSLVNGEELYIRLLDPGLPEAYGEHAKDLSVEVSVSPASGEGTWEKVYAGDQLKENGSWNADGTEIGIVLDSMRDGQALADQVDDAGKKLSEVVTPGADMRVFVVARYGTGGIDNGEGEVINSLFGGVSNVDGRATASVSKLRHLRNLSEIRAAEGSYASVSIDADISFVGGSWDDATTVSCAARQNGAAVCPIDALNPLSLVSSANEVAGFVEGNGHTIRGLTIGVEAAPANDAGLFSSLACEVRNLTIANAKVFGASRVGTLAGSLTSGANVHDCNIVVEPNADDGYDNRAYGVHGTDAVGGLAGSAEAASVSSCLATVDVVGSANVGGLVGSANGGSITDCKVRAAAIAGTGDTTSPQVEGVSSVGGLAGTASNGVTIEKSFAAVDVISTDEKLAGTSRYGGFVGTLEGGSIVRNCYAAGNVRAQKLAGGFAGGIASSGVYDCFASGDVYCGSAGGGFVGSISGRGEVANSASYGLVVGLDGNPIEQNGGFFGSLDDNDFVLGDSNAFLREEGYNNVPAADAKRDDALPFGHGRTARELSEENGGITDAERLHPYAANLRGEAFPFRDVTGIGDIWGRWPHSIVARWYHDNGELIAERRLALGSSVAFPAATAYAERPQNYDAGSGPYYLLVGWDESYAGNGDYTAYARVQEIPLHEFFASQRPEWANNLYDEILKHVDDNFVATEDFEIDSMVPGSPSNPDAFTYQVVGIAGERPVMTIGQKLPSYGTELGQFRALRFTLNDANVQVGYVNVASVEKDGARYYVYGPTLTADNLDQRV